MKLVFNGDSLKQIMDEICRTYGDYMKVYIGKSPTGGMVAEVANPPNTTAAESEARDVASEPHFPSDDVAGKANTAVDTAIAKRSPGRPKKSADVAVDTKTESTKAEAAEPAKAITKDQLIQALNVVFEKHDIDTARGVLSKFGVAKIQELKIPQYEAFLTACDEACDEASA